MTPSDSAKSIKLVIDSNLEVVFLAGLAVRAFCSSIPLDEQAAYQVELSVVEAVNNSIKHAYDCEAGHEVEIVFSLYPDRITFQVSDFGREPAQEDQPPFAFDPDNLDALPERGMGLFFMKSFMDEVVYRRTGDRNTVTLSKILQPE